MKILMLAAVLALCTPLTFADTPGRHPGYLHALSDLRYARALLRVDYGEDWLGIKEIDAAIQSAKAAAVDDGKPLEDHPHIDATMARRDRLQKAVSLLDSALHDVRQPEDNPVATEYRNATEKHIEAARHFVWNVMPQGH